MSHSLKDSVPFLALRNVSRSHGRDAQAVRSLQSVSLMVFPGEFVAIIGPSGAGKSTLLNIIGLLDRPTEGSYLFDGVETATLTERERDRIRNEKIGFVFQDSHMLLDDTAAGNAALALQVRGLPIGDRRRRVGRALAELGVKQHETELTRTLSGGERQRVAIARAIAGDPVLVLADEPTGALDSANTQNIIHRLTLLNDAGVTVVVITHDPAVAASAHRCIEIVDGVIRDDPAPMPRLAADDQRIPPPMPSWGTPQRAPHRFWRRIGQELLTSASGLGSNSGRALLLLLAFALGSGGLVTSVGISQSAATQIADRLTTASLDELTVRFPDAGADSSGFYAPGASTRTAIRSLPRVRGIGFVAALPKSSASVSLLPPSLPGESFSGSVLIADSEYLALQEASSTPRQSVSLLDNTWNGAVALVGREAAKRLGLASTGPGSVLWLGDKSVDVIGIVNEPGRDPRLSSAVILSPAAAIGLAADDPHLVVRTEPGFPAAVADAVPPAVRPDDPSAVRVDTVADLRNLQRGVGDDLSLLVGTVSVLLLVLALLMSAVAMFVSVRDRADQIALRRAVGASRSSIGRLFLFEGLLVGSAGGLTGSALGVWGLVIFCLISRWTPTLDPSVAVLGVSVGALSGLVSALYPALVAARQDPAQAIRR